jgi:ESX secretion system protein EccE
MTARITLALLFVVPAAMAYPWTSTTSHWLIGVAVAAVIMLFGGWRGGFFTTIARRRIAVWRRNRGKSGGARRAGEPSAFATTAVRIDSPTPAALPIELLRQYLDRYGIRTDRVRVTSRDVNGSRTTWISLTVGAEPNLAALRARSPRIPLHDTVDVIGRRLADRLREDGWDAAPVDHAVTPITRPETWRGVRDDAGYLAAYRISVDDRLAGALAAIWHRSSGEIWTALELSGPATNPGMVAVCAIRTADRPAAKAPLPGLTPLRGRHGVVLRALDPLSVDRLDGGAVPVAAVALDGLRWDVGGLGEHDVAEELGHAAQVLGLADVQDVVAGEPVERASIPVSPQ